MQLSQGENPNQEWQAKQRIKTLEREIEQTMIYALLIFLAFADIASVKSEPDLNRRSELALLNADEKIDQARQAYQAGNEAAEEAAMQEVAESVTLSYDSLEQDPWRAAQEQVLQARRTEGQRSDAPAERLPRRSEFRFSSARWRPY